MTPSHEDQTDYAYVDIPTAPDAAPGDVQATSEPYPLTYLRQSALAHAVDLGKANSLTASEIVEVAGQFYVFLEGEAK